MWVKVIFTPPIHNHQNYNNITLSPEPGSAFSLDISTEEEKEDVRVPKPRQSSYMAGFDALMYPDVDLTNI